MSNIFICHAGASLENSVGGGDELGVIGMAYYWNGEWIRSPEEVENRELNPVMKLKPIFGQDMEVWGDVGCFSSVEACQYHMEENS